METITIKCPHCKEGRIEELDDRVPSRWSKCGDCNGSGELEMSADEVYEVYSAYLTYMSLASSRSIVISLFTKRLRDANAEIARLGGKQVAA